ncbi:MAG: hypothetical protein AAGC55_33570, partial [Myxococcota bacterium]
MHAARVEQIATAMIASHREQPMVVVFEDLHAADSGTWSAVVALVLFLAQLRDTCPAILATTRPEGEERIAALDERVAVDIIRLEPLDRDAMAAMIAAMLGVSAAQLPADLVARTEAATGGVPLAVHAFIGELTERGALRRIHGGWELIHGEFSELGPSRVYARLSELAQSILEYAAVIGWNFDIELLCRASERSQPDVLDAIDEALRAAVVRVDEGPADRDSYAFAHMRYSEEIYGQIAGERRSEVHERVGRALAERSDTPAAVLAHHFQHSRDDALASRYLRAAADEARGEADYESVIHYLNEARHRLSGRSPSELDKAERDELAHCSEDLAD